MPNPVYNGSSMDDPYDILGVPRDADLHAVRVAYRQAVLRYHPDSRPADPKAAARMFHRLTWAYRLVSQRLESSPGSPGPAGARAYQPWELSRMHSGEDEVGASGFEERPDRPEAGQVRWHQRATRARFDETRLFVLAWVAAMALGMLGFALTLHWVQASRRAVPAWAWAAPLVLYVGAVGATLGGIVASRRVVWIVRKLGHWARRALPAPPRALPRPLTLLWRRVGRRR